MKCLGTIDAFHKEQLLYMYLVILGSMPELTTGVVSFCIWFLQLKRVEFNLK